MQVPVIHEHFFFNTVVAKCAELTENTQMQLICSDGMFVQVLEVAFGKRTTDIDCFSSHDVTGAPEVTDAVQSTCNQTRSCLVKYPGTGDYIEKVAGRRFSTNMFVKWTCVRGTCFLRYVSLDLGICIPPKTLSSVV